VAAGVNTFEFLGQPCGATDTGMAPRSLPVLGDVRTADRAVVITTHGAFWTDGAVRLAATQPWAYIGVWFVFCSLAHYRAGAFSLSCNLSGSGTGIVGTAIMSLDMVNFDCRGVRLRRFGQALACC